MLFRSEGIVRLVWVKAHMGIPGNEAANVLAKKAAEGVPPNGSEKWMPGGGIRQWAKRRKWENAADEGYQEGDGMEEKGSDKLLLTAGKKGYREVVGE